MKVKITVYGGDKHPVTYSNVRKVEKNVTFTIIHIKRKNVTISKSFSFINTNIKRMVITDEK